MPGRPLIRPGARRTGLSVVEVLLALVLVSVGLLGVAGSSALVLRSSGAAAREHRATRAAGLRLARLTAAGCTGEQSGAAAEEGTGLAERWTVGAARNGAASVEVRVEWPEGADRRSLALWSAMLC
jgi:Tfp pilus assembly protein PilV